MNASSLLNKRQVVADAAQRFQPWNEGFGVLWNNISSLLGAPALLPMLIELCEAVCCVGCLLNIVSPMAASTASNAALDGLLPWMSRSNAALAMTVLLCLVPAAAAAATAASNDEHGRSMHASCALSARCALALCSRLVKFIFFLCVLIADSVHTL